MSNVSIEVKTFVGFIYSLLPTFRYFLLKEGPFLNQHKINYDLFNTQHDLFQGKK